MTKPGSTQTHQLKTTAPRFAAGLGLIIILVSLLQLAAGPAAAQEPQPGATLYLPLVFKSGSSATPASPYAQMLLSALERCYEATGLNQMCYGNGQIQGAAGQTFTQPGDIENLVNGQSLTLTSPNGKNWSVALLRLRTDSITPDQSLILLAFGNAQISNLALFNGVSNDEAILPGLQFASSPVAGAPQGVSGLIIFNPAADEYQSITVNGAVVTLETSAFSQAKPGNIMNVTMVNGSALMVEAGNGSSAVIPSHQVSVPLGVDGLATGTPGAAVALAGDALAPLRLTTQAQLSAANAAHPMVDIMLKAIPEYFTDSKANAFYNDLAGIYETNINKVYNRCVTEPTDARSVYGLMVLNKMLRSNPNLDPAFGSQRFAQLAAKMRQCATFELEFDSQVSVMKPELSYTSHVNSQGFQLWFDLNGELFFENDQVVPIKHLNYEVIGGEAPGCAMRTILEDGQMLLVDYGFATLRGSKLKIHLEVWPDVPFEEIYYTCPGAPPSDSIPLAWSPIFYLFHQDKLRSTPPEAYIFKDWKYNGRKNFAEAIYTDLTADFDGASATSDSYLILVHTPQK
ncbi:MAG: hypothetical protein Fur0044_08120 [Anaerolineae bacterium]